MINVYSIKIVKQTHKIILMKVVSMKKIQPQGNYYDKYGSKNFFVKQIMKGFFKDFEKLLVLIQFNNVLDAGCGEGHIAHLIKSKFNTDIEAFDLGSQVIEVAKTTYSDIDFRVCSIYETSYHDNEFDLVVCSEVLEHLDDPTKALNELLRISSKYLLLSVPNEPIWRISNMLRGKYITSLGNTPGHVNHWGKRNFINYLKGYGNLISVKSPFPWTIALIEKKV